MLLIPSILRYTTTRMPNGFDIEEKCQKIDTLITELQSEIDYLKEYKQRLIADVVTGQVNVQNETI